MGEELREDRFKLFTKELVTRLILLLLGGVLFYVGLPAASEFTSSADWREAASHVPLVFGGLLLGFALLAPSRWCEGLASLFMSL